MDRLHWDAETVRQQAQQACQLALQLASWLRPLLHASHSGSRAQTGMPIQREGLAGSLLL